MIHVARSGLRSKRGDYSVSASPSSVCEIVRTLDCGSGSGVLYSTTKTCDEVSAFFRIFQFQLRDYLVIGPAFLDQAADVDHEFKFGKRTRLCGFGQRGYHPLVVSLANTKEVLFLLNRPGLAWNLKAWWGLMLPEAQGRGRKKRREQKRDIVRMGFKRFVASVIRPPCQILRSGRRLIYHP